MKSSGLKIYTICYLIFLYAPILLLPLFAFNNSKVIAFPLSGFTTQWFVEMWNDQSLWNALQNSMIVASTSAILATTFGIFAARASTRFDFPAKGGLLGLIMLPLVMPGVISSLLISFTISLDEFIIAFFLGGNETTLSVYIFGQFRFPAKVPAIMALGTILVCLSILLLATAEYFRRRGIARAGGKDTGGFL